MSGDVQPRKRKDKKKKKDELGIEEPRGTAAALGEGDVFIHSYHDHGTGGHWCAKIIFFSLLAVLITLIGLIILENRGLTELEANSVESRYSGVLEGWLEDTPDDDHHDEHTLELKHPDDDDTEEHIDNEHEDLEDEEHDIDENESHEEDEEHDIDEDESHEEDEEHDIDEDEEHEIDEDESNEEGDDEEGENDENEENDNESLENFEESDEEEIDEEIVYNQYQYDEEKHNIEENNEDEISQEMEDENNLSNEIDDNDDRNEDDESDEDARDDEDKTNEIDDENNKYDESEQDDSRENNNEETEEQNNDDFEDDEEIEHIEREVDDNEDLQEPLTTQYSKQDEVVSKEDDTQEEDAGDEDYLQADDDEPPVERITTPPAGKPFIEIEEEVTEKPIDTLAEEEEYERKQEELRREEAQASHVWLKLAVGGALLVATHAVVRRATAPRGDAPEMEEPAREDSPPVTDRRMTLVSEEFTTNVPQERPPPPTQRQEIEEEIFKKPAPVIKSIPFQKSDSEREAKTSDIKKVPEERVEEEKELYSDEEEIEEEEEEEEEDVLPVKMTSQQKLPEHKSPVPVQKDEESEPEVADDVEIIDDEQIEEEEEDDEEEEISDVDDTELLSRLEAKYGRLPEPERPGKHKDGGNSIEDEWPGEPSESYWREQLNIAEDELRRGDWDSCEQRVAVEALAESARARWLLARSLDLAAEEKRDNRLLSRAISAYLHLLKMNERLSDKKLVEVAHRTIDRIQFRGIYLNAEPVYRLLIRRFPHNVDYRNNLTVSFLMANRADLADEVLKDTLRLWPNDRVALAHHGFVLKNHYNKLDEAVIYLKKALDGDAGAANEARFYYHLGDALLQLGRTDEAHEVHRRGAELGHFLSPHQRSLYNVPRLRSRPWWPVEETPYVKLATTLEKSWREILKEGEAARALYELEKEGLMERGEWSQLDLFVQGREVAGRCARAPATCAAVRAEPAARCRRGQVKFSAMRAGTHVRAHVGPTNCRLRLHLALSNTQGTYIRVHDEIRQWQVGKTFIFDDSFEHEVWHNGTGTRLVLIVDVWHPDLTAAERRQLPAI
ncbi:unnamed protein product [Euphydryas editha]|uniref:Aspartyl/asparaginy/proline hydroxylase domain-containing protein n=1 Tax=Euphydryas editha TaxID=104508 RepID=A0AAU9UXF0_EUPED|nr:unnamed protein product [Euphydryas editha]